MAQRFALALALSALLLPHGALGDTTYSPPMTIGTSEVDGVRYTYAAPAPGAPQYAYGQEVAALVAAATRQSDFPLLEKTAEEYRSNKSRTPIGGWSLSSFYESFMPSRTGDRDKDDQALTASELKTQQWMARYPNSPTPYIVYAELLVAHGWLFRGNGYADTVTPEGWQRFGEYLAQAERVLSEHKTVASTDPQWYATMLDVALGENWPATRYEPLIAEGLELYPDYNHIYFSGAMFYTPKWGGDIDALDSFVEAAVRRTQAQSGTQMYARIYNYIESCGCAGDNVFLETRADWPRMRQSLAEILKAYNDPWINDKILHFACEAGDKTTAREALDNRGEAPPSLEFGLTAADECKAWALSPTDGPSPLQTPPAGNGDAAWVDGKRFVTIATAAIASLKLLLAIALPVLV